MHEGNNSLKACVEDDIEAEEFGKGLDSMVKLDMYKRYLHGCVISDEGEFRSGMHSLNEEKHSDRDDRVACMLCGAECESVVYMLWECFTYSTCNL